MVRTCLVGCSRQVVNLTMLSFLLMVAVVVTGITVNLTISWSIIRCRINIDNCNSHEKLQVAIKMTDVLHLLVAIDD